MKPFALLFALLLWLLPVTLCAQKAPPPQDWNALSGLLPGARLRVETKKPLFFESRRQECELVRVDATELVCKGPHLFYVIRVGRDRVLPKDRVQRILRSQVDKSGAAGLAIGAAAGAVVGAVLGARNDSAGEGALLVAVFGGLFGETLGASTDFLAGPVLYQAP